MKLQPKTPLLLDLETTGTDISDRIIEIAILKLYPDGKETETRIN